MASRKWTPKQKKVQSERLKKFWAKKKEAPVGIGYFEEVSKEDGVITVVIQPVTEMFGGKKVMPCDCDKPVEAEAKTTCGFIFWILVASAISLLVGHFYWPR